MASSPSNSDPAVAGQGPPFYPDTINQLNDDIMYNRAVLASLLDVPLNPDTRQQIAEAKAEIKSLQQQLSAARRAQPHHPASLASSSTSMTGPHAPHLSGGPSSFSGASTPSNMSTPSTVNSALALPTHPDEPSRKRSNSHLDAVLPARRENKSRRTTPSPAGTAFTSPLTRSEDDFGDDVSVIDLTGDDDEPTQLLRQEEERLERSKKYADRDAQMARQLQERDNLSSFPGDTSSQPPWPSRYAVNPTSTESSPWPRRPSATPWSSQPSQVTIKPEPRRFGTAGPSGPYAARQSIKSEAPDAAQPFKRPAVPGSWCFDSDEESPMATTSSTLPASHGSYQMPARPKPTPGEGTYGSGSMKYAPGVPAIELARQAAIMRQQASKPSSSFGSPVSRAPGQPPEGSVGPGYVPTAASGRWHGSSMSPAAAAYYNRNRPGYLANGSSTALQDWNPSHMFGGQPGNSSLNDIIRRTNDYNFDGMTDGLGKPLNPQLVNYLADFVDDPRKTSEEIKELLSNIRPDMDIPEEERGQTPEPLRYALYTHQQLALKWMGDMEEGSNKGGILADDMGLGKTISTIALMTTRKAPPNTVKTNLIIGPVALIKQWENEIDKKVRRGHRLRVCLMHGKKMAYSELKNYDVVLTTYGMLASEWKRFDEHIMTRQDGAGYEAHNDNELHRKCPIVHPRSKFYRVILDEAQCIKNKNAQSSKGVSLIAATYRWCLTGTPMMNGVTELFPLIRFLKVKPYCDFKKFQKAFSSLTAKNTTEYARSNAMQQLRIVLKAVMLRRMKNSEIDGKPILELPPKTETAEHVVFSTDEQSYYKDLESKSQVIFNKYLRQGTIGKNYSNILVLLLRLRQACCHPHLNMDVEYAGEGVSTDAMLELAKSLAPDVIERIKAAEAFECPICYDAIEDPIIVIPCGHDTCSECFASLTDNTVQNNIQSGQESSSGKCPECRGQVNTTKVINYSTFKKVHMPETIVAASPELPAAGDDSEEGTDSGSETDSETEDDEDADDDADEHGDLRGFVVSDDAVSDDGANDDAVDGDAKENNDDDEDEFPDITAIPHKQGPEKTKRLEKAKKAKKARKNKNKGKGKEKLEEVKPHMLKTLRIEASKNKEARRRYMHYLKKNWETSAKVTKITELLGEISTSGGKTIIFSQWTALLDLLEIPIKHDLGLGYCRYDGGMSRSQRDVAVHDFVEKPTTTVMLVSLRAGNAGLNLTAASHVIICDPFWNPYIEMQAVDRTHRIGQQNPVKVYRVLVKDTVEDRIVELQEKKRALVDAALDEGESKSLGRLSVQELRYLFGS